VLTVLNCASGLGQAWPATAALLSVDLLGSNPNAHMDDASICGACRAALLWAMRCFRLAPVAIDTVAARDGAMPPQVVFVLLCLSLAGAFVMVTVAPKIVANASRVGKFKRV
jgi:hypothetical protein